MDRRKKLNFVNLHQVFNTSAMLTLLWTAVSRDFGFRIPTSGWCVMPVEGVLD